MSNSKSFSIENFIHKIFGNIPIIYDKNRNIYAIARPVAKALKYEDSKNAIYRLVPSKYRFMLKEAEDYGISNIKDVISKNYKDPQTIILKEPGIYILATLSKKPLADSFRDWLFEEVVVEIRKQGYFIDQSTYERKCNIIEVLKEENEKLQEENKKLSKRLSFNSYENMVVKEIELLKEIKELKQTIRTMRRK